jgi:hypothetical protein
MSRPLHIHAAFGWKCSLSFQVWSRRALGATVIVGAISPPRPQTNSLTKLSLANRAKAKEDLIGTLGAFRPKKLGVLTVITHASQTA